MQFESVKQKKQSLLSRIPVELDVLWTVEIAFDCGLRIAVGRLRGPPPSSVRCRSIADCYRLKMNVAIVTIGDRTEAAMVRFRSGYGLPMGKKTPSCMDGFHRSFDFRFDPTARRLATDRWDWVGRDRRPSTASVLPDLEKKAADDML
ncbi:hypothetical protein ACLOJK_022779 [Asimina triloba]